MYQNERQYAQNPPSEPRRVIDPVRSRERMVRALLAKFPLDDAVVQALRTVPRHLFVPEALRSQAYEEAALPIGQGQTISQPSTVAFMTQMLNVQAGMRVLEIGTGSGYQSAILHAMQCRVFTVERKTELFYSAREIFQTLGYTTIHTKKEDGTLGMREAAPFDRIIVTAGGPIVPQPLIDQLDKTGVMIIPVGEKKRNQRLMRLCKKNGRLISEDLGDAVFVDLVGDYGW